MKWYQVDSDTPNDPKIRQLIDDVLATGCRPDAARVVGHIFLIWCHVANHGAQPGLGVRADGSPLDLDDLAYAAMFGCTADLRSFLDNMAARRLIGKAEWQDAGIVFLPAMAARADAYAKSKGRGNSGESGPAGPGRGNPGKSGPAGKSGPLHNSTRQDTTAEKHPDGDLLTDAGDDQVTALVRLWNDERKPGPHLRDVTDRRRQQFSQALAKVPDLTVWRTTIRWLNTQKWANAQGGGEHPNWRADLDWLAKPGLVTRWHERAQADRSFLRAQAGLGTDQEGRNAAKGRTGVRRGSFMAAVEGDDHGGQVH